MEQVIEHRIVKSETIRDTLNCIATCLSESDYRVTDNAMYFLNGLYEQAATAPAVRMSPKQYAWMTALLTRGWDRLREIEANKNKTPPRPQLRIVGGTESAA